jgi:cytochrome c oxidase assembly factor CtaG
MTPSLPAWQFAPLPVMGAVMALLVYLWLYRRGTHDRKRAPWSGWRVASFGAGVVLALLALISPLDGLADILFGAHMLQHMVLLVITPPLLMLGLPAKAILRALPRPFRRRVVRPLARSRPLHRLTGLLFQPVTVFCVFNGILGLWHVPAVVVAAQETESLHELEHLSFLLAGCLLWWLIVEPLRVWPKEAELSKIVFVIGCHLPMLLLGQLFLAFTNLPLYTYNAAGEAAWSLTPLGDQRLGGGIMFGLDMAITFTTISILFGRYLTGLERRQRAQDELLASNL